MALRVLDGNQTATTLSSVVTGGEHIVAHSVVSLGANAIANITSAVSGSVVSISNFPSTQTIAGTVTANGDYIGVVDTDTSAPPRGIAIGFLDANQSGNFVAVDNDNPDRHFPVKIGGSLPAISGTVTANVFGFSESEGERQICVLPGDVFPTDTENHLVVRPRNSVLDPLAISGTVTANDSGALSIVNSSTVTKADVKFTAIAGAYNASEFASTYSLRPLSTNSGGTLLIDGNVAGSSILSYDGWAHVRVAQSPGSVVTVGSLPAISGTVTAAAPNGSLTTRFGTPTTANTAFATSAVTNANRKYLLIQNVTTGSNVITVGIGFTPTTTQGIQLTAGAGITFESSYIPTGAVYVLSSVTASNFTILEA